MSSFNLKF